MPLLPCPHGKVKYKCKECNGCPHGKVKKDCKECNGCPHGKLKHHCKECKTNNILNIDENLEHINKKAKIEIFIKEEEVKVNEEEI